MKAFAPAYSLAYCIAYAVVFVLDAPLFLYYPMEGRFAWSWAPYASIGPAMAWEISLISSSSRRSQRVCSS